MAPKSLLLLTLVTPLTLAWGSNHDLYIRDAIQDLDPYAAEAALRRRANIARSIQAAKAKRSAGRVVMTREVGRRAPKAAPEPEPEAFADPNIHEFQQYDAGLFRRDGSVIPRDASAYATPEPYADPNLWFEGGELKAKRERIINAKRAVLREKRKRSFFAKRAEMAKREAEAEAAANANPEAVAEAEAAVEAEMNMKKREAGGWFSWMKFW